MPRRPKPTYVPARPGRGGGYWITRAFGEYSEQSKRRKGVRNYDIGPDSGKDAAANRAAAQRWVDGLVEEQAKAERRADNPTLDDLAEAFCEWSSRAGKELRT